MSLAFENTNGCWKYVINIDNLSGNIFSMFYPFKHSQPSRYFECFNISLSQVSSTLLWYHLWTFFSYLENKLPINYEGCFLHGLHFPFLVWAQHSESKISLLNLDSADHKQYCYLIDTWHTIGVQLCTDQQEYCNYIWCPCIDSSKVWRAILRETDGCPP